MSPGLLEIGAACDWKESDHLLNVWAYFDESGHNDDPAVRVVCVAGALAPFQDWVRLEGKWQQIIAWAGISEFHAKEFSPGGQYFNWPEAQKRELFGQLMDLMNGTIEVYVGAAVYNVSFDLLSTPLKASLIDPYYVCFQTIARALGLHACFHRTDERVHVVAARHPEFSGRLPGLWSALRKTDVGQWLGDIGTSTPRDKMALQAADWIAFELAQHADKRVSRPDLPVRWPIVQMRTKDTMFKLFNHNRLMQGFADAEESL